MKVRGKITDENKLYVQNRDIIHLKEACEIVNIPEEILFSCADIIKSGQCENEMEYIDFSSEEAVKFLDSLSYIVDYDLLKNMTWAETILYGSATLLELNQALNNYDKITDKNSIEAKKAKDKLNLLRYKMASIREIADSKKGGLVILSTEPKKKKMKNLKQLVKSKKKNKKKKD